MFEVKEGILVKCDCEDEIITLPNSIKEIAYKAFANCKAKKIICNEGLVKICSYAFLGSEIEEIILPKTLKYINEDAFANCFNLSSINLVNSLESIGDYAFKSTKLKKIIMTKKLFSIFMIIVIVFGCISMTFANELLPQYAITDTHVIIDYVSYPIVDNSIIYNDIVYVIENYSLVSYDNNGEKTVWILPIEQNRVTNPLTLIRL